MNHGRCVLHVPWCMPGSLTSGFLWSRRRGETLPAFPAHAQSCNVSCKRPMGDWVRIWIDNIRILYLSESAIICSTYLHFKYFFKFNFKHVRFDIFLFWCVGSHYRFYIRTRQVPTLVQYMDRLLRVDWYVCSCGDPGRWVQISLKCPTTVTYCAFHKRSIPISDTVICLAIIMNFRYVLNGIT